MVCVHSFSDFNDEYPNRKSAVEIRKPRNPYIREKHNMEIIGKIDGLYRLIPEQTNIYVANWNNCVTFANPLTEEVGRKIEGKKFTICVSYPFHKELRKEIKLDLHDSMGGGYGIFANEIIDAIVKMLKKMYKTTAEAGYPIYGDCMHEITDLWIEDLLIDLKSRIIVPSIGS